MPQNYVMPVPSSDPAKSGGGVSDMLKGGAAYYGLSNVDSNHTDSMMRNYAPVSVGNHDQVSVGNRGLIGGKKRRNTKRHNSKRRNTKRHNSKRRNTKRRNSKRRNTKRRNTKRRNTRRRQRGGYSQYLSNVPLAHGYSTGGTLTAADSALASPGLIKPYNHCQNNYNHMTGKTT